MEYQGVQEPFFIVTGSCLGIEISLETRTVSFGTTVPNSCTVHKLTMHNTGDIGCKLVYFCHFKVHKITNESIMSTITPPANYYFLVRSVTETSYTVVSINRSLDVLLGGWLHQMTFRRLFFHLERNMTLDIVYDQKVEFKLRVKNLLIFLFFTAAVE